MRVSKVLLAFLLVAGLAGAGAFAYDAVRPRVHPIKAADAEKYALRSSPPAAADQGSSHSPADLHADLFGRASAIDGDTLLIDGVEADLWTIDAPELAQTCEKAGRPWACGEASRAHLERLIGGRQVACQPNGPPEDGRWLGVCFASNVPCRDAAAPCGSDLKSLNLAQVTEGWAADIEGQYVDPQEDAQDRRAGVWAGRFELPWEWREREALANRTSAER